jgi:membrane-associated phospholipid phosphatase
MHSIGAMRMASGAGTILCPLALLVSLADGMAHGATAQEAPDASVQSPAPDRQGPNPAAISRRSIESFTAAPYSTLFATDGPGLLESEAASQQPPPPAPDHTGISALVRKTAGDFAAFPRRKSTWVILGIGGGAAAIAYPFDDELNEELQDADDLARFFRPGKYLGIGWVQTGAAVGIYLIGRYAMDPVAGTRTNKVSHLGFDLLRANLMTMALTGAIKVTVRRDRPTGECCAFPSGHASVTFATAAVVERHFGYRASWPMFVIAGYVAASRLTENRHFLSDVLFGSALGMAAGWTVVGRHGRDDFTLYPMPVRGGLVLAGSWTPGRHDQP